MDEALSHRPAERGRRVAAHHRLLRVEHEGAFVAELAAHDGNKLRRRAAEQAHVLLRDRDAERPAEPVQRPVVVAGFPVAQRTGAEPLPVQNEDLCADPPGGLHIVFVKRKPLLKPARIPLEKQHRFERGGERVHRLDLEAARFPQAVQKRADKSQIFQTIRAIQSGEKVYAAVAPAFVGQFGPKVTPGKLRAAMKALGFADVFEVAIGADLCAKQEAEDFLKEVPDELPFMATSCCPAWSVMAKKLFPEHAKCISMALTPMTLTARLIKQHNPDARVVFIGPCAAKKLEAMRRSVRSEVDFVLTFEEMTGIFSAKHVDLENIEEDPAGVSDASTDGRNFAVAGGVAQAVVNVIKRDHPDQEIKVANAEGLKECRQLLKLATLGKYPGYLLEGMACPGGCVAGAGTMQAIKKSQTSVGLYAKQSTHKTSSETEYIKELDKLVD